MRNSNRNVDEPSAVSETKEAFNQYFTMIGKKDFRQFYYDWHINAMVEPFAEVIAMIFFTPFICHF